MRNALAPAAPPHGSAAGLKRDLVKVILSRFVIWSAWTLALVALSLPAWGASPAALSWLWQPVARGFGRRLS